MWPPEHALVTGASSGIGCALARLLSTEVKHLTLLGRHAVRLEAVAAECRDAGAETEGLSCDVRDRDRMKELVEAAFARRPIDLLVANAGISGSGESDRRSIIETNLLGVLNTVEPAIPLMEERQGGHIAIMSSLAGFKAFPNAPLYCASKSAVRSYGEALDARLRDKGITVSVLCPGFIATPLTDENAFPMPLIMTAEEGAQRILDGLRQRRARIAFPKRLYALVRLLELLPTGLANRLIARMAGRSPSKE